MGPQSARLHAQLSEALRATEPHPNAPINVPPDSGALWRLASLLFEPPLGLVVSEIQARPFRSQPGLENALAKQMEAALARDIGALAGDLHDLPFEQEHEDLEAQRLIKAMRAFSLEGKVLPALAGMRDVVKDVHVLVNNKATSAHRSRGTLQRARALHKTLDDAAELIRGWSSLASRLDITTALRDFEETYRIIAKVVQGLEFPPQDARLEDVGRFLVPARQLAHEVLFELALRPQIHQSVLRLRVHLETFARLDLIREMKVSRAAKSRNESILQREMDRFIFAEGFFPLTHFQASGGSTDTAFENRRATAIEQAPLLGSPPALIELKQVVKLNGKSPSATDVRKAVESGTQQAVAYRASLGALWPSHEIYAVVVYNGATRYLPNPNHPRVVLVYLGDTTPSGAKQHLKVELGSF